MDLDQFHFIVFVQLKQKQKKNFVVLYALSFVDVFSILFLCEVMLILSSRLQNTVGSL